MVTGLFDRLVCDYVLFGMVVTVFFIATSSGRICFVILRT